MGNLQKGILELLHLRIFEGQASSFSFFHLSFSVGKSLPHRALNLYCSCHVKANLDIPYWWVMEEKHALNWYLHGKCQICASLKITISTHQLWLGLVPDWKYDGPPSSIWFWENREVIKGEYDGDLLTHPSSSIVALIAAIPSGASTLFLIYIFDSRRWCGVGFWYFHLAFLKIMALNPHSAGSPCYSSGIYSSWYLIYLYIQGTRK